MPKPGGCHSPGISLGDVLRLPKRHPAWRRREARPGFRMERENLFADVKGQATSGSNREGESTEAERRDGAARGRGKAVQDPETGNLGSLQTCEGEPGSGWSRWTVDCGVRG